MKRINLRPCIAGFAGVLNGLPIIPATFVALLIACESQPAPQEIFDIVIGDLNGAQRSLAEIREHRASVFIFLGPECPLSKNYTLQVREYSEKYKGDEIVFYNIFPGKFMYIGL